MKSADSTTKISALEAENRELKRQLAWFRRQLFGTKSERRILTDNPHQPLLDGFDDAQANPASAPASEHISYTRRKGKQRDEACVTEQGLRFDDSVPLETIDIGVPPELADAFEVISYKDTYRLAQRPASYVVLHYRRPVVKRVSDGALMTVPAPDGLWRGAMADVSVVAGLLVDKFCFHLPLYRQHQRMAQAGITVARSTPGHWSKHAIALLEPIFEAQLRHILRSRTLALDETPLKAGRAKGKMKAAWLWPVYGEDDEVAFTFAPTRGRVHLERVLEGFTGTLLCDGASAYESFVKAGPGLILAQCWAHTRRGFVEAQEADPSAVAEALELIGALYAVERHIGTAQLVGEDKRAYRQAHARPAVDAFFTWATSQCERIELTPSHPLARAIAYAQARQAALRVYLDDPSVEIDTNHVERTLRCIPMGRKNWNFCWNELGAKHVGIIQSLLSTCQLHGVDPYTYLVDVLQRVSIHPASEVEQLTPRCWKTLFADDPLVSDLALVRRRAEHTA